MNKAPKPNSRKSAVSFSRPSRTVKSAAYEADINNMISGKVPFTQSRTRPFYIDETVFPDTLEASFNLVIAAQDAFMALPPQVRERFSNDPAALAAALADPRQRDALIDMGILPKVTEPPAEPSAGAQDAPQPSDGGEGT